MTDEAPSGVPPSTRPERAKTGRAKPPPRAKLTMDMLLAPTTGVDALLASLRTIRFSTTRLSPPSFLASSQFTHKLPLQETQRHSGGTSRC